MSMDPLAFHKLHQGKLAVQSKVELETREDLAIAYSPGVAEPCKEIAKDTSKVYDYTNKGNFVAVVSDGTAVLGLGDIGPEAAMPVMEGKAILFKEFGGVDAFPICVRTKDVEEIIQLVKWLEPTFGGINLEDISAPRCFEIERRLKEEMNIPVFHDDQHGTAIVVLAGLINAAKVVNKNLQSLQVVINGAGAAGMAITWLLQTYGMKNIILCDSKGVIHKNRDDLNSFKKDIAETTNVNQITGTLADAVKGADVFLGLSKAGQLTQEMVRTMERDAIVFAMANPIPEIMPDEAKAAGAKIIGTGRSDFPNQINNVLAFPGLFRGVLDARAVQITDEMKIAAAEAIASYVQNPTADCVIPSPLDKNVANAVAEAVKRTAKQ